MPSSRRLLASTLIAVVSIPGFLVGHTLRHGDGSSALWLLPVLLMVVLLAGAIMRQSE